VHSQIFGVARGTVTRWMRLSQKQGEVGLNARAKGRSRHPVLYSHCNTYTILKQHCCIKKDRF
jgi:hypothetical protein